MLIGCVRLAGLWDVTKRFMGALLLLSVLLAGCNQQNLGGATGGTGESFGGGDELREAVQGLRSRVLGAQWAKIPQAPPSESFCDFQQICSTNQSNPLCSSAPVLSGPEIQTCNEFIRSVASNAASAVNSSQIEIEVVTDELLVAGKEVTARTELSATGKIWFSLTRVNLLRMTLDGLAVLLTHEMLHKTLVNQSFLEDNAVVGNFGAGKGAGALFTAVGYAITLRHIFHRDLEINGNFPALGLYTDGMKTISSGTTEPSIAHNPAVFSGSDFTWSFLVQVTGTQPAVNPASDRNMFFLKGNDGTLVYPYACEYLNQTSWWGNDGKVECSLRDQGAPWSFSLRTEGKINDGRTHLVVFTRRGNTLRIYLDGRLDVERTSAFNFQTTANTEPLQIGNRNLNNRFRGKLGFMHLWRKDLSASEIQSLVSDLSGFVTGLLDGILGFLGLGKL